MDVDPMTTGRTVKPNCGWAEIKNLVLDPHRYPGRQGSTAPESNTPLNLSTMRIVSKMAAKAAAAEIRVHQGEKP
jgi:hypothetical protein